MSENDNGNGSHSINIRVILVEPAYDGNIGSVCRAMKNFGFDELVLVNPCQMTDFAKAMASHAQDILSSARIVDTFEEALDGVDIAVGTTGKPGVTHRNILRKPYFTPEEVRAMLEDKSGTVALVFGREDRGLLNEHLEKCDIIMYVPTSGEYPVMNLSHAAAVCLYVLADIKGGEFELASRELVDVLYDNFEQLLDNINYPEHKRDGTLVMLRRIFGRAMLNEHEFYTLMGVLHDTGLALVRAEELDTSWVENN